MPEDERERADDQKDEREVGEQLQGRPDEHQQERREAEDEPAPAHLSPCVAHTESREKR
jgi:hypothetical protein